MLLVLITLLALSGCSLPGLGGSVSEGAIKIGAMNYTEPNVLAYVLKGLIEHETDLTVEVLENLGTTTVVHQAKLNGEIDISANRYVGTDLTGTIGAKDPTKDPEEALRLVQEGFQGKFNQTWFDPYGFENTYAFTVRQELADQYGLETISDLKDIAQDLKLGVDNNWLERPGDGYKAFVEEYGFEFGKTFPMDIGLVYKAVSDKEVDIVLAYSTDGRIKEYGLKVLKDDKHFFPPYQGSAVATNEILEKHPDLSKIINKLVGKISTEKMTELNHKVDVLGKTYQEAAKEFLKEQGLID